MSGQLTTHVLDTAHGKPAAGITVELWREHPDAPSERVARVVTNAQGRTDSPLLAGELFQTGRYLLRFFTDSYWRSQDTQLPEPPFLDMIPVAFGISDPEAHYHVPLLVSPWAYSTYRGS